MKRKSKLGIAICSILVVISLCGCAAVEDNAVDLKAGTNNGIHNLKSTVTLPDKEQALTAVDVQATVGCLTVTYGDKPQIEIGSQLVDHSSISWSNGTLIYRDNLAEHDRLLDEIDSEDCMIAITLPTNLTLKTLSIEMGIGSVDLHGLTADTSLITVTGKINLNGFQSQTLELNSTLADISATDISIKKELCLNSYGSTAAISGDIRGKVLIDSAGISNTEIVFVGADRDDYAVWSTWKPETGNREAKELFPGNGNTGILIDGEQHSLEYADSNSDAPYQLEIISRELMPMENINLKFTQKEDKK